MTHTGAKRNREYQYSIILYPSVRSLMCTLLWLYIGWCCLLLLLIARCWRPPDQRDDRLCQPNDLAQCALVMLLYAKEKWYSNKIIINNWPSLRQTQYIRCVSNSYGSYFFFGAGSSNLWLWSRVNSSFWPSSSIRGIMHVILPCRIDHKISRRPISSQLWAA